MASPTEHQIYVFATSLMAAFFVAAMVRLWLLRRVEEKLLKNKEALEKQIVLQQKDLLTVRQESNAWRMEMQRQFDLFRHMASDQLGVEEKRFNELLAKSTRREYELQTALDIAKQMCSELPAAKARILYLESHQSAPTPPPPPSGSDEDGGMPSSPVTPMPDLSGGGASLPSRFIPAAPPAPAEQPSNENMIFVDQDKFTQLEEKLAEAEKKNAFLWVALTTTRRSRLRPSSLVRRPSPKKWALAAAGR
ncbi:hypothetical protein WJU23_12075 [Prosthecobacter sp. SYSU 5D2]|uniref:hypothetical protein n=1 Tax=Prosthecobacter sp. SYSU 5D2 TaxID=3134134 RepID=UPI0031FE58DC